MQFFKLAVATLSIGSVVATPVATKVVASRDTTVVSSITSLVSGLNSFVASELASIQTDVVGGVINQGVVPLVETALTNIETQIKNVTANIASLVNATVLPLTLGELANIPTLLTNVVQLLGNIQAALKTIGSGASTAVLAALQNEIKAVQAVIAPFLSPITGLITNLANSTITPLLSVIIKGANSTLSTLLTGITTPITSTLTNVIF